MALTRDEATERAGKIWGQVTRMRHRAYDPGTWTIEVMGDERGHYLDGNGHADCHPECQKLEASAYPAPDVEPAEPTPDAPIVEPTPVQTSDDIVSRLIASLTETANALDTHLNDEAGRTGLPKSAVCPCFKNEVARARDVLDTAARQKAVCDEIAARVRPEALASVHVNKLRLDELIAKIALMDAAEQTVYDADPTDGRTYAETILECAAAVALSAH